MTPPLISVIIPCHNQAQYIAHALDAMLAQTYTNLEIIVVNDNSTDNLDEVVKPYQQAHDHIQYVRVPDDDPDRALTFYNNAKGVNAGWRARNVGVAHATGELITFQDADDGSCANRIEVQYGFMKAHGADHVVLDWQLYQDKINATVLPVSVDDVRLTTNEEIVELTKKTARGLLRMPFVRSELHNPLMRFIHKVDRKWFRDWTSFPGAGSMPLVQREVFDACQFRDVFHRTRPALSGRGADRDFNYLVAETFQNSLVAHVPMILWRVPGAAKQRV